MVDIARAFQRIPLLLFIAQLLLLPPELLSLPSNPLSFLTPLLQIHRNEANTQ